MSKLEDVDEYSFKSYFVPLTTQKAIHILIFVGVIVYFSSLFNGFVIDDKQFIVNNAAGHSLKNILSFFIGGNMYDSGISASYYRPVFLSYVTVVNSIFGASSFWFHLSHLFFHILNSILVFFLFSHFFKKQLAFILSLVFLIHPINSEPVLYASSLEVLYFFFGILALFLLLKKQSIKRLVFAVIFLLLSLLSKETGILFILVICLYSLFFNIKKFYLLCILSIFGFLIYLILRIHAIGLYHQPLNAPIDRLNIIERLITLPSIFVLYLKNFFFPVHLSASYQWAYTQINFNNFFVPLFIVIFFICIVIFIGILTFKRNVNNEFKIYVFFTIWFFIGIAMHLQIVPLDYTAADRFFYFPIVGLLGMLGIAISNFRVRLQNKKFMIVVLILVILLSARTIVRSFDWKDNFTLASHDIKISKDSYDLEMTLGTVYLERGNTKEAKKHMERSISLYPYINNYTLLGFIYQNEKNYEQARKYYLKALEFGDFYLVYENLSLIGILSTDPYEKNIEFTRKALKKFPQDPKLWLFLAISEYESNSTESAKRSISEAYNLSSTDPMIKDSYNKILNGKPLNLDISKSKN